MNKLPAIFGSLLLLLIIGILIFIFWQSPKYDGEVKISGMNEEVEVHFDKFGIPHIYTQIETDAYRALGFVHAQD